MIWSSPFQSWLQLASPVGVWKHLVLGVFGSCWYAFLKAPQVMLMCSTVASTPGKCLSDVRVWWVLEVDGNLETGSEHEVLSSSHRSGQVQAAGEIYICVFCESPPWEAPCCVGNCLKTNASCFPSCKLAHLIPDESRLCGLHFCVTWLCWPWAYAGSISQSRIQFKGWKDFRSEERKSSY